MAHGDVSTSFTDACYSKGGAQWKRLAPTETISDVVNGLNYLLGTTDIASGASYPKETTFDFEFNTNIGAASAIYAEADNKDVVQFCMKRSLIRVSNIVANYAEIAFDFRATLGGNFILAEKADNRAAESGEAATAPQEFDVSSEVCGVNGQPTSDATPTLSQGDEIKFCVKNEKYRKAALMDITSLKCGDGEGLTFVFFNGANPKPGLATEPFFVNADADSSCKISIFPLASFYPTGDTTKQITCNGEAALEFGRDSGTRH